jgi:hypothetical protein
MSTDQEELKEKIRETHKGIPAYRLDAMMGTAAKITRILANMPLFLMTLDDAEIVLDIVKYSIGKMKEAQTDGV